MLHWPQGLRLKHAYIQVGMATLPDEVRWELLEANYQTLPPVILSFPLIGWLAGGILRETGLVWLTVWQASLAVATLVSLVLCWAFRRSRRRNYRFWSMLRSMSAALNGITFGLAGMFLMVPDHPGLQLYLFVIILGGAAASVTSSSSHLSALLLYLTLSLMPITLHAFTSADASLVGIAQLVPICWAVMLGVGFRSYRLQRRSALLAHQNRQLVNQLTEARGELEVANRDLNLKVAQRTRELSRFKVLLDASSEGILVASATTLQILDWNQPATTLLKLSFPSPGKLNEISPLGGIPWAGREGARIALAASAEQPIEVSGTCQSFDGELYFVLVVRDASERLKLEKQLLSAQKIEVVGQLAGGIAHDFNNMLTVVLGVSEYLRDSFAGDDPRRQDVTDILETGERAKELTAKLLRLSRSKLDTPELLDLNERIRELSSMLKRSLAGGIELVVLLHDQPQVVRVVPGDIDQVLLNLAVNASDAMAQGGSLTIELCQDPPPASLPAGSYTCVRVSDTGPGMPPEVLARAFDPFFSTKGSKGHGLGLAVSESILRRASGLLAVESQAGQGCIFRMWLPLLAQVLERRTDSSGSIKIEPNGASILLVEDQDALRSLLERQLTLLGYRVTVARSSEEALALAANATYDLLLSDIVLPGKSGVDLAHRLAPSVGHILLISGYADQAPCLNGQPLPLLSKPFTGRQLARRILQLLGATGQRPEVGGSAKIS